jgi:DNA-directed RNA polymerase
LKRKIICTIFYINYQGSDLSSALINFYRWEKINESGKDYLYIHGANNHNQNNISKQTFCDRINWVKDNYNLIINLDK